MTDWAADASSSAVTCDNGSIVMTCVNCGREQKKSPHAWVLLPGHSARGG